MRCCANCEWSISPELEKYIMEEQGYNENDPNRTKAGDCCLGEIPDNNYCCKQHLYIEGMEEYETFVLYDETYMGPGYLIISKLDGEVAKFMKISCYSYNGFPIYSVRAFEKDSIDNPDHDFREISFTIKSNEPLYNIISTLSLSLNGQRVYSIDRENQGQNNLQVDSWLDEAKIILSKDVYGVKHATNYIDIVLGDNMTCMNYEAITLFYNSLAKVSKGQSDEKIQRLLLQK